MGSWCLRFGGILVSEFVSCWVSGRSRVEDIVVEV